MTSNEATDGVGVTETQKGFICCLCNKRSFGWGDNQECGNNPAPLKEKGECCDYCNDTKVLVARLEGMKRSDN